VTEFLKETARHAAEQNEHVPRSATHAQKTTTTTAKFPPWGKGSDKGESRGYRSAERMTRDTLQVQYSGDGVKND